MIQVGEVLDKYELLERVGQGGMAIVYRGLDRTLKRVVAVKILHSHLADYQEARDRFEREAQAVAKLRHENILEIFDFASRTTTGEDACYIVTEFIDGRTLKQVTVDRAIAFPEIGAMIVLQVCRALAHAHAQKILHRDIKPENIMIRSDGVVKLMDFGISHMVDLERLTVTGQLLGSPAYMSPEHVEGRPLDFRTDVFAVGIVLYQLTTGKLPFEGKNPHEVLKRIAECRFVDPRQVNPRIGNRLGRVILRAMAAKPDDRYPAIGEMVTALEHYLDESGLPTDKIAAELARYFNGPVAYEQALQARLVDHLTRVGQQQLAEDNQSAALDVFDRVLTIEPNNARVLAILDRIAKRRRLKSIGLVALGACVVAGGAFAVHARMGGAPDAPPDAPAIVALATPDAIAIDAPVIDATATPIDAVIAVATKPDAGGAIAVPRPDAELVATRPDATAPDASSVAVATTITVTPGGHAWYRIGTGDWKEFDDSTSIALGAPTTVTVKKDECCEPVEKLVEPGRPTSFDLGLLSATITPTCNVAGVLASVDGHPTKLGSQAPVQFGNSTFMEKSVVVQFVGEAGSAFKTKTVPVTVKPGGKQTVTCE